MRVRNSNTYGFTLSMNADQPNLVNGKDSTYKIDSVSGTNQQLAANQWGYGIGKDSTTFNSVSSATLADVTSDSKGNCNGVDDCTLYLTFAANLNPKRLPTGSYSTSLTYTATSKPAPYVPPAPDPEPYVPPTPPAPEPPKWTTNGCVPNYTNCILLQPQYLSYSVDVEWRDGAWYTIPREWFNYDTYNTHWAHLAALTYKEYNDNFLRNYMDYSSDKEIPVRLNMDGIKSIMVAVPRYVVQGNNIVFCRGEYFSDGGDRCGNSKVSIAFRKRDAQGGPVNAFWVSAYAMGCKNAPRESLCTDNNSGGDPNSRCLSSVNVYDDLNNNMYIIKDRHDFYVNSRQYGKEYDAAMKDANFLAEALGSPCY